MTRTVVPIVVACILLGLASGCPRLRAPDAATAFDNQTDASNHGASFVGAGACRACHDDVARLNAQHGHVRADVEPRAVNGGVETGVQCESCHGPGSNHFGTRDGTVRIDTTAIFVDSSGVEKCDQCHGGASSPGAALVRASRGFIESGQQAPELRASGGHSTFACTFCHDPHASVVNDRAAAIRNECAVCHTDRNMAQHDGHVFVRGDYSERLTCVSCHMPFAGLTVSGTPTELTGAGRMGDVRTHIFRIDIDEGDLTVHQMLESDGAAVRQDAHGRAAVTVDFVCLRCHDGTGNAFPLRAVSANGIAVGLHLNP